VTIEASVIQPRIGKGAVGIMALYFIVTAKFLASF